MGEEGGLSKNSLSLADIANIAQGSFRRQGLGEKIVSQLLSRNNPYNMVPPVRILQLKVSDTNKR